MASSGQDLWQGHARESDDVTERADLDLAACLEAAEYLQEEVSQHLHSDADTSPWTSSWTEDVIEMTSSGELTSSSDHLEAVSNSGYTPGSFSIGLEQTFPTTTRVHFSNIDCRAEPSSSVRLSSVPTLGSMYESCSNATTDVPQPESAAAVVTNTRLTTLPSSSSSSSSLTAGVISEEQSVTSDISSLSQNNPDRLCIGSNAADLKLQRTPSTPTDSSEGVLGDQGARLRKSLRLLLRSRCRAAASTSRDTTGGHQLRLPPSAASSSPDSTKRSERRSRVSLSHSRSSAGSISQNNAESPQLRLISSVREESTEKRLIKKSLQTWLRSRGCAASASQDNAESPPLRLISSVASTSEESTEKRSKKTLQTWLRTRGCAASTSQDNAEGSLRLLSTVASTSHERTESLQGRLHPRSSEESSSQERRVTLGNLPLSLASSTSSLTESVEEKEKDTDDAVKLQEKREKNRLAAQKCRDKKRGKKEKLEQVVSQLEEKKQRLREKVEKLRDEKDSLEAIVSVHSTVCPHIRKTASS